MWGASSYYQHVSNGGISMTIDKATSRSAEGKEFSVQPQIAIESRSMGVLFGAMTIPMSPDDLILMGQWLIQEGQAAREWFRDDIGVGYPIEIEGHREWSINKMRERGSGSEGSVGTSYDLYDNREDSRP
jgi:hypothetical protein